MKQKALIIGAGIAGTCLAHQLLAKGLTVQIIDQGSNHSSAVAAGIVNPMVFRRMNKSWRLDDFHPEAQGFYQAVEKLLGVKFYHPLVIRRFFSSEQERKLWEQREQDPAYEAYLEKLSPQDLQHQGAKNTFGSGRVKKAFWIDAAKWVERNAIYFQEKGLLLRTRFDAEQWHPQLRKYKDTTYDFVIFCMGYLQKEEQTFAYLPVQQTKGQTLLVESDILPANESLNRKCFVLPYGNKRFRVGATYEWDNPTLNPTEEGKNELLTNLESLGAYHPKVVDHFAGVRPTVLDRRPVMGAHPKWNNVFVFNGLGAKGYMMAPTLARELVAHITEKTPLDPETNISRFTDNNV
jgi:glycine/D-amino acid oxidase-like deaminating enzyme